MQQLPGDRMVDIDPSFSDVLSQRFGAAGDFAQGDTFAEDRL